MGHKFHLFFLKKVNEFFLETKITLLQTDTRTTEQINVF